MRRNIANENMEKTQFNARVRPAIKVAACRVADVADFTYDEIMEAAFAALFGTTDRLLRAKRDKAKKIAKDLEVSLTFNGADLQLDGFSAN